ncbi:MAG: LapA family protein [Candidatus Binatia bacterium]
MYLRTILIVIVLGLLAIFALFNWSAFMSPTTLTFGVGTVEAPLGLILLAIVGLITLLFLIYIVLLQSSSLLESRRQTRELQSQRDLADRAEESRFQQLRLAMETELTNLETQTKESNAAVLARLDALERDVRSAVEQSGNTLAAYLGEIEDRFERAAGSKG